MAIKEKQEALLPVYLINGEDELKRQTVLKRLHKRIEKEGDLSFNYDVFQGASAAASDIVSACNTIPFGSGVRLVQVNDANAFKKSDLERIIIYLATPNPTTVLALVASRLAKNTRLFKAVSSYGAQAIIDCTPQKRYELARTLRSIAVTHGITLSDSAAQTLIDLVGENTIYLNNELKKIALSHRGNDLINEKEVRALVSRTAEVKPWEFVDAFSMRDIEKTLKCFDLMKSVTPHALLAMCISRIRELICAWSLYERGTANSLSLVLRMPDWRVKNHVLWAQKFTRLELRNALISARDTEQAMKSGTDPRTAFLDWVLQVLAKNGASGQIVLMI